MNCQEARIYLSGRVDGELTADQEKLLEEHLRTCPRCRKELDELLKLKEVTSDMRFTDLPDKYWAGYWNVVYNRLERGLGWILLSVGAIILAALGTWEILRDFFLDPAQPIVLKLAIGSGLLGLIILLISVLRERLFARKHERYEEVER